MFDKNTLDLNELLSYYNKIEHSEKKAMLKSYKNFNENPLIIQNILYGGVLGDMSVERFSAKSNSRIRFKFGKKNIMYAEWLYNIFRLLGYTNLNGLKHSKYLDKRTNEVYETCVFVTYSFQSFNVLRETYYPEAIKIIPKEIQKLFTSSLSLAILIQDDGSFNIQKGYVQIATNCFSKQDLEVFVCAIQNNFQLFFKISVSRTDKKTGKIEYVIRLYKDQVPLLIRLVKEHMLPSMWYKLGLNLDGSPKALKKWTPSNLK
jgi:hypothetical protein